MKLTHKIIKLLFSLCVIVIGQNAFGQREIQPYEDSFTYDYALKYHSNLSVREFFPEYFFLENFKAPKGVKSIVEIDNVKLNNDYMKSTPWTTKDLHIFNVENGFILKSLRYYTRDVKNNEAPNPELLKEFTYKFDTSNIKINVVTSYDKSSTEYIFDNKTEHLTHIVKNNKDTVFFTYSKVDPFELETYQYKDSTYHHKNSVSHGKIANLGLMTYNFKESQLRKNEFYISSEFKYHNYPEYRYSIKLLFNSNKKLTYYGCERLLIRDYVTSTETYNILARYMKKYARKKGHFGTTHSNMSLKRKKNNNFLLLYNFEKSEHYIPYQRGVIRFKQNNIYYKDVKKKFKPAIPEIIYKYN